MIGAGVQARVQMQAAHLVRPFKKALVWSPVVEESESCAKDIEDATGASVAIAKNIEAVVSECQFVVTTTPALKPFLMADWLHPGLHITCMGSDQAGKNEIAPATLAAADLYVCDSVSQCEKLGELRSAREAGLLLDITPPELGEIIVGAKTGRASENDITICDLTGTGAQDTAIANFALKSARSMNAS